jgi:hypothetical protein
MISVKTKQEYFCEKGLTAKSAWTGSSAGVSRKKKESERIFFVRPSFEMAACGSPQDEDFFAEKSQIVAVRSSFQGVSNHEAEAIMTSSQ